MDELAKRFHDLFAGLERVHGRTSVGGQASGGDKIKAKSWLERSPPTEALWERHLAGEEGLGIVPIRDDGTCRWGAIDVDRYDLDLYQLAGEVERLELPLVVCRSKSGGAHVFLFGSEDLSAELVRDKLMTWAVVLGYGGVEVFPKQTNLASERDVGNWLNMPYFGGERSNRYAVVGDRALSPAEFLDRAAARAVDAETLVDLEPPQDEELGELLREGPPCLQTLAVRGLPEGTRNNGLYNFAVYLRKRYEEDWPDRLDEYNQKFMDPPLKAREVSAITASVKRKPKYQFKCNDQPICDVCNKQICLTRRYGVGLSEEDLNVVLGAMTVYNTEPRLYIVDVNARRIELTVSELMDQRRFARRCIEEIRIWPNAIGGARWRNLVQEKLNQAEQVEPPEEMKLSGTIWAMLEEFLTGRAQGTARDELLDGRAFTEDGWTHFRTQDFEQFLKARRYDVSRTRLYALFRERELRNDQWNVRGACVRWWAAPAFEGQHEPSEVPRLPEKPPEY